MTQTLDSTYWATADSSPFAFYEQVREAGDLVWDAEMSAWLVTSLEAARYVLRNDDTFQHPYLSMDAGDTYMKIRSGNRRSMMFLRGEQHTAMHRWWIRELLSPRAVREYLPTVVTPAISGILDSLDDRDGFDLADDYAERIPVAVFANLLAFPDRDDAALAHIKALNDRIGDFASVANSMRLEGEVRDPEHVAIADRAVAAGEELNDYLRPLIEERRKGEGTDFISRLWAGGHQVFEDWNELDTLDACRRLLFAGIDTTTHALGNASHMLLTDESLNRAIRTATPERLASFVEEVFRLEGSVHFRPRRAAVDAEVAGHRIAAGDMLIVLLLAANRDPKKYGCPLELDLDRETPRDHIAFNYGPRSCPGAALARSEVAEGVRLALERFPQMRLDPEAEPPGFLGFLMRSYRPLHVLAGR